MTTAAPKKKAAKKGSKSIATMRTTSLDFSGLSAAQVKKLDKAAELVQTGTLDAIEAASRAGAGYKIANEICTGKAANEASVAAPDFRSWCEEVGHVSKSTAYRQIALNTFLSEHPALKNCTSLRALYDLSAANCPPGAIKAALRLVDKGEQLSEAVVDDLIDKHSPEAIVVPAPKLSEAATIIEQAGSIVPEAPAHETNGETNGDGATADPPPVINVTPECSRGGNHEWESDGGGKRFCLKCHEEYSKKEHGAKLAKNVRDNMTRKWNDFLKFMNNEHLLERVKMQADALQKAMELL